MEDHKSALHALTGIIAERFPELNIVAVGHRVVHGGSIFKQTTLIDGIDGESLLMNLDIKGFAVSTGAACSSGNPEPSPALRAMGLSIEEAQSSMRISLGWGNTREQVLRFIDVLEKTVQRLRELSREES